MKRKNIKKAIIGLSVSLVLFNFLSCSAENTLRGSGTIITERRELNRFAKVYNPSSVNISILQGAVQSLEVSADDNVINTIRTTVENEVLKIDLSKGNYVDVTINISIVIPNLEGLENSGSGNMTVSGFEGLTSLAIDSEGSGSIALNGSAAALTLRNSGSGNYQGFGCVVNNCTVTNSGSGNCEINCTDVLSGSNSGSGSVFYKGAPSLDLVNTGSGNIVDSN